MRHLRAGRTLALGSGVAVTLAGGVSACGDDKSSGDKATATPLVITTFDAGSKRFETDAPESVRGGLVKLTFTNASKKVEHEAQLVRIDGGHTTQDVLKLVSSDSDVIPDWVHFAGGSGGTPPGRTRTATLNLPAGKYVMIDSGSGDNGPAPSARGALAEFDVTAGEDADLPASNATVTASTDEQAEPENSYEVSGALKVGKNQVRFATKGEEPHHMVLFPIVQGNSLADVKKFLLQQGAPSGPPPVDFENGANSAILEGDTQGVIDLQLRKPGTYAMVCFVTDRNGKGKPHFADGMLKEIDVN